MADAIAALKRKPVDGKMPSKTAALKKGCSKMFVRHGI